MSKRKCNALTTAGTRCQNAVEEGDKRCPAGHTPVSTQVANARSRVENTDSAVEKSGVSNVQASETDVKFDFTLWGDWTSVGQALLLIPLLVLSVFCLIFSLLPVFLILWNVIPGHWLIPVAAYYAIGLLFFVPPIENFMWEFLDRSTREPSLEEWNRLSAAWDDVISRVGKGSKRRYRLRVTASTSINAYAAGGRQVAITQGALQYLSDSELRGIVAHELGHHAGLHPVLGLASHWIIKPIRWAQWVSILLHNISAIISRFARKSFVFWASLILGIFLLMLAYTLRGIVYLTQFVMLWFSRRAEYLADKVAVQLGFGTGLLSSLHVFQELEYQEGFIAHDTVLEKLLSNTHPPIKKRIARVEAMIGE